MSDALPAPPYVILFYYYFIGFEFFLVNGGVCRENEVLKIHQELEEHPLKRPRNQQLQTLFNFNPTITQIT
ncbi:hypothetical protein V6Z11_A12G217100 [Gossypium hirsutum]|uniref:Uncharacterized protein n=2 Tax=Gossypium TaxID=3633 RepID=A0A5D2N088_GOSTO|nr:hypothetical protein ES332_A12G213000v1 [Gossypium tomentosum]